MYLSKETYRYYNDIINQSDTSNRTNLELFKKWHETNDSSYREKIILNNLKLVLHISAKMYSLDPIEDTDDLFHFGIIGLICAIDTYDYNKGYAFSTYAMKIIQNHFYLKFRKARFTDMIISLDQEVNDTENLTIADIIEDPNADIEKDIMNVTMLSLLESAIDCLTEKEKDIVVNVFGLYGYSHVAQTELAKKYNCHQMTISRIKNHALKKIKNDLLSKI